MENQNPQTNTQQNNQPVPNQVPPPTPSAPPPSSPLRYGKVIGLIVGGIIILGLLTWLGVRPKTSNLPTTSNQISTNQTKSMNQENKYSENQLEEMLLPQDSSKEKLDAQETAIQYIFKHPEEVNPFTYATLSAVLKKQSNIEQAAFWFYIFQSRSGAWVAKDTDESRYPALKASFNETIGRPINEWAGSDVNAWHDLVIRAISYEKKFRFYGMGSQIEGVSDDDWGQALKDGRENFEKGFTSAFEEMLADGGKNNGEQRKANGLYVGPWQNPGKPLLEEWR